MHVRMFRIRTREFLADKRLHAGRGFELLTNDIPGNPRELVLSRRHNETRGLKNSAITPLLTQQNASWRVLDELSANGI